MRILNTIVLLFLFPIQGFAAEPSAECAVNQALIADITKKMNDFNTRYSQSNLPRMKRCGMTCDKYKEFCKNLPRAKMALGDGLIARGALQTTQWPQDCAPYVQDALSDLQIKMGYLQNGFKQCESCDFSKPSTEEAGC